MLRATHVSLLLLGTLFAAACGDPKSAVDPIGLDARQSLNDEEECGPDAVIECPDDDPGGGGWPFFGTTDDNLRSAPGDPSPGAAGIWLGSNTTDETCIAATGRTITDADKDWLDDGCEYRIAYAFAPTLMFYLSSPCPAGEPYWAAKYFAKSGIVRIAYMPAYYTDCGEQNTSPSFTGHTGDSEYVYVELSFNRSTRHWQFDRMWLSAHYGAGDADRSELVSYSETQFSRTHRSHPRIWVAPGKHANYKSVESCRQSFYVAGINYRDLCQSTDNYPIRFPVTTSNNVGSRFVGTQCVYSRDEYAGSSRRECFYADNGSFRGWQTNVSGKAPPPYFDFLMSSFFESRYDDWGPGPAAPALTTAISGPEYLVEYTQGTWTASVSQGYAPYTYRWSVDGTYVTNSSTLTRWAGARGSWFDVELEVTDSQGARATDMVRVYVSGPNGEVW